MSEMDFNKIFAAILIGGLAVMLTGFFSKKIVHEEHIDTPAYPIEGVAMPGANIVKKVQKPDPVMELIAIADISRGEKLSKQCAACHSFTKDGPNQVGPNLWNIVGNPKGSKDFSYSAALTEKGGSWSYASLNHFLWKPKVYISGTKMNYIGIKKPEDRAAMIAWLRTLSDSPVAFPSASDIEAEKVDLAPPEMDESADAASVAHDTHGGHH